MNIISRSASDFLLFIVHNGYRCRYDTVYGANLNTFTAANTFFIINTGKVVFYGYGIRRTNLCAFCAGNTANLALFTCCRTFFGVGASYCRFFRSVKQSYNSVGACLNAYSAADAFIAVYMGNPVFHTYCINGAGGGKRSVRRKRRLHSRMLGIRRLRRRLPR